MTVASFIRLVLPPTVCKGLPRTIAAPNSGTYDKPTVQVMRRLIFGACSRDLPFLLDITSHKASQGLETGLFTSQDLVIAFLARIKETAEFNAVLEVNPDALGNARALDKERAVSGSRGYITHRPTYSV